MKKISPGTLDLAVSSLPATCANCGLVVIAGDAADGEKRLCDKCYRIVLRAKART